MIVSAFYSKSKKKKSRKMESSPTSNPNPTNVDKPDELVSSADIHQIHPNQQNGDQVTSVHALQQNQQQLQSQQQKKCLHHRIFDVNTGNIVNERVAAFTNAILQQVNHQSQSQTSQMIQRPFPMQQQISSIARNGSTQQSYQHYPIQQIPSTIPLNNSNNSMNHANNTHFTVGINNYSVVNNSSNASTSNSNAAVIHNQSGLVQQMNAALLAERYLLLDLVEGSTLYKCIDVKTHDEFVCKVRKHFFYFYLKLDKELVSSSR